MIVQLEDLLAEADQANVPGTTGEHPNWRRRSPVDVGMLGTDARFIELADALRAAGRAISP